jgi:solute carrier family 35, member F5
MLTKTQKLILGIVLLILVDIIWVSSSELTKVCHNHICIKTNFIAISLECYLLQYLYQNEEFDKPFFCTYFKTSMFMFYLLFIGLIAPWKESCNKMNNNYMLVESVAEDDNFYTNGPTSLVGFSFEL